MRIMLDTHILIWFLEGDSSLSISRRKIISKIENEIFVSVASLWEMAIKISLGKLLLAQPLEDIIKQLSTENIEILPILPTHTLYVSTLTFHHKDPFDRMIISQSIVEKLSIITDDGNFADYKIKLI